MKNFFITSVLAISAFTTLAVAAPMVPTQAVTFAPTTVHAGDPITISAFIFNNTASAATVIVQFQTTEKEVLGTKTDTIAAQTAKNISIDWKMPLTRATVQAIVVKATDQKKKEVPELEGLLGEVVVGTPIPEIPKPYGWEEKIKGWWNAGLAAIEAFRVKEAVYFTQVRDRAKAHLGLLSGTEAPVVPTSLNQQNTAGLTPADGLPVQHSAGNPVDYMLIILGTALSAFFGNAFIFYIGFGVVVLFLLRFLTSRFT